MTTASAFVSGLMVAGYLVIALFFLRFWRDRHDRLFAFFAAAFLTLAIQRTALTLLHAGPTASLALYGLRALAFLLILWAIMDANRATRK